MKIFATGLTGFIGQPVAKLLTRNGFEVHALTRQEIAPDTGSVIWHSCSIFEHEKTASLLKKIKPAFLLHLGWGVERGYLESAQNYDWVWASFELLRSFVENRGKKAVFAGTCFEYDLKYAYCSENSTPLTPSTVYGKCKNILRQLVETYCVQNNVEWAWGRIFYPFGPGEKDDRFFPAMIKTALKNEPIQVKTAQQFRDFVYVEDVAEMFVELLSGHCGGAVNIASGIPRGRGDIVRAILAATRSSSSVEFGQIETGEPDILLADVNKLRSACSCKPTDFEVGLRKTIDYWRAR